MSLTDKENTLINILKKYKSCAIAFSGGTDSSLLLYYISSLRIKSKAYTFHSYLYPESELLLAKNIAKHLGISHEIIYIDPLKDIENIKYNPKNRCYICKKTMFSLLRERANSDDLDIIIEGSNFDDTKDFRPGFKAVQEIGAISPLNMAEITKQEVRELLKKANIDYDYNKPSFACYFSRFPYNLEINRDMIEKVSICEEYIHSLGFNSARLRYHENIARIEANRVEMKEIVNNDEVRNKISSFLKSHGFIFVCIELEGYVTGSMNRLIKNEI